MNNREYWYVISRKHQSKVRLLAQKHSVTTDQAFRNIVNYLMQERINDRHLGVFNGYLTGRQIEKVIDLIEG